MMNKSILTIALTAATIAIGSLAGAGDAEARKKGGGFHGGGKGGGFHGHVHHGWKGGRLHGHRWHNRWHKGYFYTSAQYAPYDPCYFSRQRGRLVRICPVN